ncbi:DUF2971 domain-containing protein, partial [Ornithobacterium rhinotracheale]
MNFSKTATSDELIPKILYKYRDWNIGFHKKTITDYEIFLSSFTQFNDELDGKFPFIINANGISKKDFKKRLESINKIKAKSLTKKSFNSAYKLFIDGIVNKDFHQKYIDRIDNLFGAFSLCDSCLNQQMWAYYANSNQGFCIGFNSEKLYKITGGTLRKVNYCDKKLKMPFDEDCQDTILKFTDLFFTKKINWQHEQEYRILKTLASKKVIKLEKD